MWIRLKNIQVYAYHGYWPHEREHGGRFEIDVEIEADFTQAIASDDLSDTIDYVKVQQAVLYVSGTKHFHLLEALADSIAMHLLDTFPLTQTIVRVRKPGASLGGVVDTVEIECHKTR